MDTSVIKHFSFHRSLNLGNLKKPLKTRKLGTWELMSLFVETSQICMLQKPKKPTETYINLRKNPSTMYIYLLKFK